MLVSKQYAGGWLKIVWHVKVQASVKEAHIVGCENNELHADFDQYDVDGFAVKDETVCDVPDSECAVLESAEYSAAWHC